jgi:transposase-like protein
MTNECKDKNFKLANINLLFKKQLKMFTNECKNKENNWKCSQISVKIARIPLEKIEK